uniref:uncharacterized protein LOC124057357 isoform X2 n=1 Tax=Scatophagus argus TaxID=75038 RepID=UPI001ED7CE5B|nr:uncharacterized protein LOC124057357 isoform X2 [Scatophagus argus]
MKVAAGLMLLLINVHHSYHSCFEEALVLFCSSIPAAFMPGYSSLVMLLNDVEEINATVLRSDDLASVTSLRIEDAGLTRIAEGALGSFQNLTKLKLDKNLLTEMNPNWLSHPDTLSELSLTETHIHVLKEFMLKGLIRLTTLSLNKNRIRTIDSNSFSSQTALAYLDLSENRLTHLSPEVFRSLTSTRIRLDGNPWSCSCGAEDFVDLLKDLQSKSRLDRQVEVTCDSPPSLRGRPVWNVSVCVSSPPSVTQTVSPKPAAVHTTVPLSTGMTTPPSRPTLETRTSVQPEPTDARFVISSHTATPPARPTSETRTPVRPTDNLTMSTTPALKTETNVTSLPSVTQISVHPKPSDLPSYAPSSSTEMTENCVTSPPSSDTVRTLVVVIVVLSSLLFVMCFLVVLHRRKRSNKTVTPTCPKVNRTESKEDGSRSSHAQSPGQSEKGENNHWDSEVGWRRSFTGVRAKSANAILFTSPFCVPGKDQVTLQSEMEPQSRDTENQTEGKQNLGNEAEADGRLQTENPTNTTDVSVSYAADGRNLDKDSPHVAVNSDTVPYLSIGTNRNNPNDFNEQSTKGPDQKSQMRKVMARISTWPPTAAQWQARCKMTADEEGSDEVTVWTPKCQGEMKKVLNKVKHQTEDPLEVNDAQMEAGHSESPKLTDKTTAFTEAQAHADMKQEKVLIQDPAAVRQTTSETQNLSRGKLGQTQVLKPAERNMNKSSRKTEQRNEAKQAVTSTQRGENRSRGSKAPSGGASPDDETLLSGNEYAFMDLLHEVVQNNGRWTRDRWKQTHAKKQRR